MPFWILDRDGKGKPLLFGPFYTEMRAQDYSDNNLSQRAEVHQLPTRDKARATGILKAKLVDRFHNRDKGMEKFRHPKKT